MKTLSKIWSILDSAQRRGSFKLLCFIIISMIVETIGIGMIIPAVALIMEVNIYEKYEFLRPFLIFLGNPSHTRLIFYGLTTLVLVFLLKNMYLTFFVWWQAKFATGIGIQTAKKLFTAYLTLPYTFHLQNNSAKLIRNIAGEVMTFQNLLQRLILLFSEIFILIGIIIFLLAVELQGTLIVIFLLGVIALNFNYFYKDRLNQWSKERLYYSELATKHMIQGLNAIKEIKVLGREKEFISKFVSNNNLQAKIRRSHETLLGMPRLWIEFLGVLVLSLVVFSMVFQNRQVDEIISLLGLFAVAAFRIMPSINRIISSAQDSMYYKSSVPVIASELDKLDEINLAEESSNNLNSFNLELFFEVIIKNLNFSYFSKNKLTLSEISFNIEKGECLGITGESGSGKTTLVDILLGLLEPKYGSIQVNGKDIYLNIKSWKSKIGYVPQTIYLTDDSIKNNIALGISEEKIDFLKLNNAIHLAQLSNFVNELDDGIETVVGERGIRLSGGQRQRIGIARALYHEPAIIMMDEATSSLDNKTESELMKSIYALKKERTIIIVAHRHSTIQNCDKIIKIEGGKIINIGKPEEVLD